MNKLMLRTHLYLEPAIAVAFLVVWALTEAGRHQIVPGLLRLVLPWWAALLGVCVAMALARIRPLIAMALSVVVVVAQLVLPFSAGFTGGTDWPIYFGFLVVMFGVSVSVSVSVRVRRRRRALSLLFAIGMAVAIAGLLNGWVRLDWRGPLQVIGSDTAAITTNRVLIFILTLILSLAAWFLGASARVWQQKLIVDARLAETTTELNRSEVDLLISRERDQLAQDVHDVMAHSLSVIIAQADGARFVAADRPQAVTGSLSNIADSARASLTDVRMLIETLVTEPIGHFSPKLAELGELVERMRSAGLQVELDVFGDPVSLAPVQELAAYRIVQESLTNALKHGGANTDARVAFDWRGPGLAIAVSSHGMPAIADLDTTAISPSPPGRGLHGMRARAQYAGGWLKAGPDEDSPNTYIVTAFIPTASSSAAS
jgi:signal transduction histidine kinase